MLIIISQVVLLLAALALPLKNKRVKVKNIRAIKPIRSYRIDTDTSNANYAINEFGTLERINRVNWDEKPEFEN
ncbi:hypothetical protein ACFS5N_04760 [Mucilaginibacter ximonensis]|uniref:Uncharacterized protein n=1 Tax=Mucilaginibacter ximonensis TaxID=538021 RepID=A0ABW5Y922_9SPHI